MAKKLELRKLVAANIQPAVGTEFNPLSAIDIARIEGKLKVKLPSFLKTLLKTYGAFSFAEPMYYSPKIRLPRSYSNSNQVVADTFYGKLHKEHPRAENIAIVNVAQQMAPYVPTGVIPIGDDGLGDILLLGVKGRLKSNVLIYDHELRGKGKGVQAPDLPPDILWLALSLEDFFAGLTLD